MKCIGGKDYYDGVSAYDQTIVFDRRITHTIENPFYLPNSWNFIRYDSNDYRNHIPIHIVFCGKVYGGIAVGKSHSYKFYYNVDEYLNDFKEHINKSKYFEFNSKKPSLYFYVKNCEEFCIENKITVGVSHYFDRDDYKSSYWNTETKFYKFIPVYNEKNMLLYNYDNLKSLDFAKVIDPYQASQEIERWVSGVLTNAGNPMVSISDDSKITKYGFDKKISFRHPTKIKV